MHAVLPEVQIGQAADIGAIGDDAHGGLLVLEDSAQLSESAEISAALRAFPGEFHEPFYDDYLEDDLACMLRDVGFVVETTEPQFVAKVVVARRPA